MSDSASMAKHSITFSIKYVCYASLCHISTCEERQKDVRIFMSSSLVKMSSACCIILF